MYVNLDKLFIFSVFFAFSHGSSFYVGLPFIKPSFLFGPLVILLSVLHFNKIDGFAFTIKMYILCMVIFSLAFILSGYNSLQYIDNYYFSGILAVFLASYLGNENVKYTFNVIKYFIIITFILLLLEMFFGLTFVSKPNPFIFSGAFNNPNDVATILVVFYPLLWFLNKKLYASTYNQYVIFIITLLGLLITMSRTALALFILLNLLIYINKSKSRYLISIGLVMVTVVYLNLYIETILISLKDSHIPIIADNATRLWLFIFEMGEDKSVGARSDIYLYFFKHFNFFDLGAGIKNYSTFFAGANVIELAELNPHSFLIDLSLSFGVLGAFFYFMPCLIAAYCAIAYKGSNEKYSFYLWLSIITYIVASFIPSSIFRLPIFLFPIYFAIFCARYRY